MTPNARGPMPAFAALALAAGSCIGQTVYDPIQVSTVSGTGDRNGEPVIVASPLNSDEVLVAWIADFSSGAAINYRVTTSGFVVPLGPAPSVLPAPNTSAGTCAPCPSTRQGDPAVAASRATGDLYLGAVFFVPGDIAEPGSLGVARKRLGLADFDKNASNQVIVRSATPCFNGLPDRPSLAAGPKPPDIPYGAPEAMYFTWSGMTSARSVADVQTGTVWECNPANPGYPAPITSGPGPRTGWPNPGSMYLSQPP